MQRINAASMYLGSCYVSKTFDRMRHDTLFKKLLELRYVDAKIIISC